MQRRVRVRESVPRLIRCCMGHGDVMAACVGIPGCWLYFQVRSTGDLPSACGSYVDPAPVLLRRGHDKTPATTPAAVFRVMLRVGVRGPPWDSAEKAARAHRVDRNCGTHAGSELESFKLAVRVGTPANVNTCAHAACVYTCGDARAFTMVAGELELEVDVDVRRMRS